MLWRDADGASGAIRDDIGMEFLDRRDAGRQIALQLKSLAHERPVVVALPRGGVPVAFEVARALNAPLEILAVRKLGAPGNPEFAIGAIAEDGSAIVNRAVARRVGVTERSSTPRSSAKQPSCAAASSATAAVARRSSCAAGP